MRCTLLARTILTGMLLMSLEQSVGQNFFRPVGVPTLLSGTTFSLTCDSGQWAIYPGQATNTYAINGNYLGPTLELIEGDSVSIQINNQLGETTSLHWHGLHVPAAMDGGPETVIPSLSSFVSRFVVKNRAGTYWYHPHVHMLTQTQVTKGMAGMIIVRDSAEASLNLPRSYGNDDFPLILQDRKYDAYNQFFDGPMGDSMLVNGVANPYLNVPGQMVRFRILNGSNARTYMLGFGDNSDFYVIASDGGLLAAPFQTNRLPVHPGERYEIVKDFSMMVGNNLTLKCYSTELPNTVPGNITGMMGNNGPLDATDFDIMEFRVIPPIPGGINTLPTGLTTISTWDTLQANRVRNRTLTGQGMIGMGSFYVDGNQYIMGLYNDTMRLGDIELWNVTNYTNIAHPMHIHDVSFRILSRNGQAVPAYEEGWKDVFDILPQETVSLIMRFQDYANPNAPYMYHCHNLAHEDMGMMSSFIVVDTISSSVGDDPMSEKDLLFPNPANQAWTLRLPHTTHESIKITLMDISGREIDSMSIHPVHGDITIPTADLPNGFYLIRYSRGGMNEKVIQALIAR